MAWRRSNFIGADIDVTDPLRCQAIVGVLSLALDMVSSLTSKLAVTATWCNKLPANSSSELLMVPCGFLELTKSLLMEAGNDF